MKRNTIPGEEKTFTFTLPLLHPHGAQNVVGQPAAHTYHTLAAGRTWKTASPAEEVDFKATKACHMNRGGQNHVYMCVIKVRIYSAYLQCELGSIAGRSSCIRSYTVHTRFWPTLHTRYKSGQTLKFTLHNCAIGYSGGTKASRFVLWQGIASACMSWESFKSSEGHGMAFISTCIRLIARSI